MKNILIIDDNKDIVDLFKTILESSGYACTTATGGKAGIEQLKSKQFDLTLLDLAMPEVSGLDVLEYVKKDPGLSKSAKILIVTASSPTEAETERIRRDYPILDLIKKPINKTKLLQTIDKY